MPKKAIALLGASHPGPCAVVTAVAAILAVSLGYPPARVVLLAATVLAGQLSIGWSNDWIDAARDAAVGRTDKPTVSGAIRVSTVRNAAFVAAVATILLSLLLGPWAAAANLVCVGMGWAYNAGLKNSPISFLPYAISFGLLPALATLGESPPRPPTVWVLAVGALLGIAAHFTNVLPDLRDDHQTGVRGLPHRMGATASGITAFACLAVAAVLLAVSPGLPPRPALLVGLVIGLAIAAVGSWLVVRRTRTRLLMRLVMTGAIVDVLMLALAGQSISA